jgi:hypothetical protein
MKKPCKHCGKHKVLTDFSTYIKNNITGNRNICNPCLALQNRNKKYVSRYGITLTQYKALFKAQKGRCAICESKTKLKLAVDHCHKTLKIRALLCGNCNMGLGKFKDNIKLLFKAIQYIRSHK